MSPEKQEQNIEFAEQEETQVELEQQETPWSSIGNERRVKIKEAYQKEFAMDQDLKDNVFSEIGDIAKGKENEFALNWAKEHKEELKEQGIDIDAPDEALINIAIEKGAFDELKKNKDYAEAYHELDNLDALLEDIKQGKPLIASRFLALNVLQRRKDEIWSGLRRESNPEKLEGKQKAIEEIDELQRKLTESITGESLDKQAQEYVDAHKDEILEDTYRIKGSEEEFINKRNFLNKAIEVERAKRVLTIKSLKIQEQWDKLSELERTQYWRDDIFRFADSKFDQFVQIIRGNGIDIEGNSVLSYLEKGYKPQNFKTKKKGIFRKKYEIELKPGEAVDREQFFEDSDEASDVLGAEIKIQAQESLRNEYKEICNKRLEESKQRVIMERVFGLSFSAEKAVEGTEGMYQKIKDRLAVDYIEKGVKREKKTKQQLEALKERYEEKGKELDDHKIISEIALRSEELEDLSGNKNEDGRNIAAFLDRHDLVDLGKKKSVASFIEQEKYQKALKSRRGFIGFILDLIDEIMNEPAEKQTQKKKKQAQEKRKQKQAKEKKDLEEKAERAMNILRNPKKSSGVSPRKNISQKAGNTAAIEAKKLINKLEGKK